MKKLFIVCGVGLLAACGSPEAEEETAVVAEEEATAASMSVHETSWTFEMDGKSIFESIDADGNYIANAGDEHFDHGTYEMVNGQNCFTSAMNDEGQMCWTMPAQIAVGETIDITSNAGEELTVTRVEYEPLNM